MEDAGSLEPSPAVDAAGSWELKGINDDNGVGGTIGLTGRDQIADVVGSRP